MDKSGFIEFGIASGLAIFTYFPVAFGNYFVARRIGFTGIIKILFIVLSLIPVVNFIVPFLLAFLPVNVKEENDSKDGVLH